MADVTVSSSVDTFMQAANQVAMQAALNLTLGGSLTTSGAHNLTLTLTEATNVTLPTSGTLAVLGENTFSALQTITQVTANAGILSSTGFSLTGSNATNMLNFAGTWNTSGSPAALLVNMTNTASGASSRLFDFQIGGISRVNYNVSDGFLKVKCNDTYSEWGGLGGGAMVWRLYGATSMTLTAGSSLNLSSGTSYAVGADVFLARKAAATWQLGLDAAGVTNQMLTAASRITSDGVGANLTIAGGNGRGGAGGSLIFSTYTTGAATTIGTLTTRLTLDTTGLLTFADAVNMAFNITTGTKIGTATNQKIGFWNATPVVQQILATGGGATVDNVISLLQTLGLCKQS